jgi:3(or 17)beta-hydroxysteroid dehydrogenase
MLLKNRVVLVTGGGMGLGEAIALRCITEGAVTIISDVQAELGASTATRIGARFIEHDVASEASWLNVMGDIERNEGRLDVLVNNAGILGSPEAATPVDTSLEEWRRLFSVNVDGVFLGCKSAIPLIAATGGGAIVNLSSVAAMVATPRAMAYGATKATVRQMTKSVAQYCAEHKLGIRCNSVHPGMVRTAMWNDHATRQAAMEGVALDVIHDRTTARIPLGDFTLAEDVASAVVFLASDQARHSTGIRLMVDGGLVDSPFFQLQN